MPLPKMLRFASLRQAVPGGQSEVETGVFMPHIPGTFDPRISLSPVEGLINNTEGSGLVKHQQIGGTAFHSADMINVHSLPEGFAEGSVKLP